MILFYVKMIKSVREYELQQRTEEPKRAISHLLRARQVDQDRDGIYPAGYLVLVINRIGLLCHVKQEGADQARLLRHGLNLRQHL